MGLHKVSDLSVVLIEVFIINFLLCGLNSNDAALHQPLGLRTIQYSDTLQFDHVVPQTVVGMHLK